MTDNNTDKTMELLVPSDTTLIVRDGRIQVRIQFNKQGGVDIHSDTSVVVYSPVGNDDQLVRTPQIGETVKNGWKYGGISKTTDSVLFVAPKDEPKPKTWQKAIADAASLKDFLGYNGSQQRTEDELLTAWKAGTQDHGVRLATMNELNDNLYPNLHAIGGFNTTGREPKGLYWSCTDVGSKARDKNFGPSGFQSLTSKSEKNLGVVRLVRS
ncbi:MAG: hypothetical protein AUJ12_01125 [Alphaproteobacteria bacterium CG1_02_46_17]|nr:MAG: hypothetical protein AUJ12_01125 [Alphaproteobacteria bacterium CG1_02_46_17]